MATRTTWMVLLTGVAHLAPAQLNFERRNASSGEPLIYAVAGDFNNDRRLDIAGVAVSGGVIVLPGRGDGTFEAARALHSPVLPARMVAVGDLNADGRADLAISNLLAHTVSVALGRGDGTFATVVQYACGRSPNGVAIADFSVDGRSDIAVANNTGLLPSLPGTTINVLLGHGDGTFGAPVATTVSEFPFAVEPADFNADGKADLLVTYSRPSGLTVLISKGAGAFETPLVLETTRAPASRTAVADFNLDGKADIGLSTGGAYLTYLGNGDGTFRTPPLGGPLDGLGVIAGDFNWDGIPDLTSVYGPFGVAIVMLGKGDGSFGEQLPYEMDSNPSDFVVGDFNSDGGLDLLATYYSKNAMTVLLNNTRRPAIVPNGVVNSASFLPGPMTVTPGEIVSIFGRDLGPANLAPARLKSPGFLDTVLEGTRVLFDDIEAPLIFARADQVSAVVPYGVSSRPTVSVRVAYRAVVSAPAVLRVAPSLPGVFTADASGSGQAAVINQDGTFNSAMNPGPRGSIVTLFATGEGQTNPPGVDGMLAIPPFPAPVLPVIVGIANIGAEVLYAGPSPGFTSGLMQINARIPDDAPSGPRVPLVIRVGEALSQSGVTIAVR